MNNLTTCVKASIVAVGAASCLVGGAPAHAQEKLSAEQLAKLAQNPIANLISVPFQNNINFNYGPRDGTQNILNIQPVIPFSLGKDWNLITRTILPIVTQPAFTANESTTTGLGDLQLSGFLSPASAEGVIWGAGAIMQAPTHGSDRLGNDRWGLGPTFVALRLEKGSPWVYGALVNNVWSVGGGSAPKYNNFLLQPFLNYNFQLGADHHRELGSRLEPALDGAARRRRRQDLPLRAAAGEHAARRVLQRGRARQRPRLAAALPDPVHVPEVADPPPGVPKNTALAFAGPIARTSSEAMQ
jgi:hypothetical protein